MNSINEAIKNLQTISESLKICANKRENYNTDFGFYLGLISKQMNNHANDLENIIHAYGETNVRV